MRRLLATVVVACVLGSGAEVGIANTPGGGGPIDPPDLPDSVTYVLTVTPPGTGSITGTGIDCPGDCDESFTYLETADPPEVTLTATGGPANHTAWWSGCDQINFSNKTCTQTVDEDETVALIWNGPPTASITSTTTRINGPVTWTASANDAETGIQRVKFYIDNSQWDDDSSAPYTMSHGVGTSDMQDGQHTVRVRAVDNWGNEGPLSAAHTFTVDTSGALTSFTAQPPLTRCDNPFVAEPNCARPLVAEPPSFNWVRAPDTQAVFCLLDPLGSQIHPEGSFEDPTCASETGDTPEIPADSSSAPSYDGAWRSVIFVRDDLNNVEEYVYEWTLDRRGPSIFLGSPQDGAVVKAPFTLSPTATDSRAGVAEVGCDPGTGSFGHCSGTHDPTEGQRTIRVRAVDTLGNVRLLERSILYDRTKPQVQITEGPADGAFTDSGSVRFGFTASDAVGPLTTTCRVDQGEFGACSGASSHSLDNLAPGIHGFTLRVVDAAGHETVVARQFVVPQPTTNNTTIIHNTTATTTPGGSVGGAVGDQIETPAPLALARGRASRKFSVRRSRTSVKRLVLSGLVRGAKVQVKCKGRGCFRKTKKYTARKSKLNLTRLFKKRKLSARARIEIYIAQKGRNTRVYRITMQKGKKKPKVQSLCLPAGAKKPQRRC